MTAAPRLLTFWWPGRYLNLLGRAGHDWDVVVRQPVGSYEPWSLARRLPGTMRPITPREAQERLARGTYSAVVCHQVQDLREASAARVPHVCVFHGAPALEELFGVASHRSEPAVIRAIEEAVRVFDSPESARTWGLTGEVVAPGLDVEEYGPFSGDIARILTIAHFTRELPLVSGGRTLETVTAGLPVTLLGTNPSIPGAESADDATRLRESYRRHRVYLNIRVGPFGSARSLAVLEAMASGMPVVTLADAMTPVEHGANGFVGDTPARLRLFLLELLENHQLAATLGSAARETVRVHFPLARFVERWREVLARCGIPAVQSAASGDVVPAVSRPLVERSVSSATPA